MNQSVINQTDATDILSKSLARRNLALASLAHALHDGFTDMIYVLLPIWRAEFGLDYVALAILRALHVGVLAALQVPSAHLARHMNARTVLVLGTLLSVAGYVLAGFSGGLLGLCASLALAGAGGSMQHPLASAAVSRAYGERSRGLLGTYNSAGDLGKATIPPLLSLLLTATFRHSFGTLLKANGEDIKTVQELLRHAKSRITLDVYTQAVTSNKRAAQSKVVRMVVPNAGTLSANVGTTDFGKIAVNSR